MIYWLVVSTHLKNMSQNGNHFRNFRGENKKYLKPPPRDAWGIYDLPLLQRNHFYKKSSHLSVSSWKITRQKQGAPKLKILLHGSWREYTKHVHHLFFLNSYRTLEPWNAWHSGLSWRGFQLRFRTLNQMKRILEIHPFSLNHDYGRMATKKPETT